MPSWLYYIRLPLYPSISKHSPLSVFMTKATYRGWAKIRVWFRVLNIWILFRNKTKSYSIWSWNKNIPTKMIKKFTSMCLSRKVILRVFWNRDVFRLGTTLSIIALPTPTKSRFPPPLNLNPEYRQVLLYVIYY